MVRHVYERAVASGARQAIVATDDQRIRESVEAFNGRVCMTSTRHESGTERLAEVVDKLGISDSETVVNVQGDEPFIPVENIAQVAENLSSNRHASMATLSVAVNEVEEAFNPNAVKVVTDKFGFALYFSRSPIPYDRNRFLSAWQGGEHVKEIGNFYQRHIGIYAYRAEFIKRYSEMDASPLEKVESLEQLRVLWHGKKIHVAQAQVIPPPGIDTPADLKAALQRNSDT